VNEKRIIILAVANIPVYILLGKIYFGSWSKFLDCVKYWLTNDTSSYLRGQQSEDVMSTFNLYLFVGGCAALIAGEYYLTGKFYG